MSTCELGWRGGVLDPNKTTAKKPGPLPLLHLLTTDRVVKFKQTIGADRGIRSIFSEVPV
jgi:hypothetical protein